MPKLKVKTRSRKTQWDKTLKKRLNTRNNHFLKDEPINYLNITIPQLFQGFVRSIFMYEHFCF